MSVFKDQLLLLVCAIVLAVVGWLVNIGLGDWTPLVILCMFTLITSYENRQLKKQVRELRARLPDDPPQGPPL